MINCTHHEKGWYKKLCMQGKLKPMNHLLRLGPLVLKVKATKS